jgi:hypothetical protein
MRLNAVLACFSLLLLLVLGGCKNPCKNDTCVNGACLEGNCLCNAGWMGPNCDQNDHCYQRSCGNGYCASGTCICDAGYEGNTCNEPVNQKYAGNYFVTQNCDSTGSGGYSAVINAVSGTLTQFRITNLYNFGTSIGLVGSDRNQFTIARQPLNSGYDVDATGTMSADARSITLAFTVYAMGSSVAMDKCTATMVKY